jgi:hypothetical protein
LEPVSRIDKFRAVLLSTYSLNNKIMEKSFTYIGVDISKLTFDVAILKDGKYQYYKFENQVKGSKSSLSPYRLMIVV